MEVNAVLKKCMARPIDDAIASRSLASNSVVRIAISPLRKFSVPLLKEVCRQGVEMILISRSTAKPPRSKIMLQECFRGVCSRCRER